MNADKHDMLQGIEQALLTVHTSINTGFILFHDPEPQLPTSFDNNAVGRMQMSKAVVHVSADTEKELYTFILSTEVDEGRRPEIYSENNRVCIIVVADLEIMKDLETTKPDNIHLEITEILPPAEFYIKPVGHDKETRPFRKRPPLPASLRPRLL